MEDSDTTQAYTTLRRTIENLQAKGICYACRDLETGELFRDQNVVFEDSQFRVALDLNPRMRGHTIILYKPHREDLSELTGEEAGPIFAFCVLVTRAIKEALGADKVYVNTMCDGEINHFHLQLFPRYPGDRIGSQRFVAPRGPVVDGADTARRIREALLRLKWGERGETTA
jgi:histidine triad (HIT) family protein